MVSVPMVRRARFPWTDMRDLQREVEGLFGGTGWSTGAHDLWAPAVDVEETPDELVFRAELPGMNRDDVEVELEDGVLTIQGEKKFAKKEENAEGLLYERRWGTFNRRFTLPRAVAADRITADLEHGILTIRVPKAEEAKGRKIEVRGGEQLNPGRDVSEG
ncbi:MAG TPA: Hsp20/alpha crystallin family protein [Longimicrobiales bacterium]|nr:Hsp20/alpha crystallin family protein [Longimicrobiales bacterium]